jgi:hypothetical protein
VLQSILKRLDDHERSLREVRQDMALLIDRQERERTKRPVS